MPAPSSRVYGSVFGEEPEYHPKYTGSPTLLLLNDLDLFVRNIFYIPCIFLPPMPWPSGRLDELYPTAANIFDICLHCVLFVLHVYALYVAGTLAVNTLICGILNRGIPSDGLKSTEDVFSRAWARHEDEYWIFLNGICVGKHWLQSNIDRISRTFHRPVVGVHNPTSGVLFDIIQCLVQRALLFATDDIRQCYVLVKKALYRPDVKKVVLILHSQGGIEGGMILDWLLNEVPQDLIQQLEVYTFGCLANHFNNPYRDVDSYSADTHYAETGAVTGKIHNRVILHIEHYANKRDFASRFGVLNFEDQTPTDRRENRFMGKVFVNPASGHQLNQHYLDTMFPLDPANRFTREPEKDDFMNMDVVINEHDKLEERPATVFDAAEMLKADAGEVDGVMGRDPEKEAGIRVKMKKMSRLWLYRNGGSPVS
ncbi:hypothetical protein BO71DRAFT_481784 [Aspergillus ellipticus CBS 707.79]|uniref:DUF676 domain-containing protein n=1 Tax=Aspergillus ellipticus CBS 707.79 TaxID=1448320 RepID=A0A319DH58_9EURO|nr:hypothetical protein BO71DRAFT_481784 [Aspergillus ellipticus CBS 707.79]